MTFTIFTNGTVAKAPEVNANFDSMLYAILYNRMENDNAGQTQLNECIISDIFADCNGSYNTICAGDATSYYNSTSCTYTSLCCINEPPATFDCYTCIFNYPDNWLTQYASASKTKGCAYIYGRCNDSSPSCATGYSCFRINNVNFTDCIDDYCYIKISYNRCHCAYSDMADSYTYACLNYSLGSLSYSSNIGARCSNCTVNNSGTGYIEYCKTGSNVFDYYVDGVCQGEITNLDLTWSMYGCTCINRGGYNLVCQSSSACIIFDFCLFKLDSVKIPTNIKEHNEVKKSVYFVTDSAIPTGSCITADIYNQNGLIYACDVNPKEVTNLCVADSCCFYADIKLNSCSASESIETRQYAVYFM